MTDEITINTTLKNELAERLTRMATAHGRPPVEIIADIIERGLSQMPGDLRTMFEAALALAELRHRRAAGENVVLLIAGASILVGPPLSAWEAGHGT